MCVRRLIASSVYLCVTNLSEIASVKAVLLHTSSVSKYIKGHTYCILLAVSFLVIEDNSAFPTSLVFSLLLHENIFLECRVENGSPFKNMATCFWWL